MNRVEVTRKMMDPKGFGLFCICYMQVCAVGDATDDEILEICNRDNPSGTSNGWSSVVRKPEDEQESDLEPVECDNHKDRLHFMVRC